MKEGIKALLVQSRSDPLGALRSALEAQSIDVCVAGNCAEAALVLWSHTPPHIVFTEVQLADGNWADVLTLAAKASAPVNVIVAARFVDVPLYVQVIERGAFDFIVPPLSEPELLHVVRIAVQSSLSRRHRHAGVLPTGPVTAATQMGKLWIEHAKLRPWDRENHGRQESGVQTACNLRSKVDGEIEAES